MNRRVLLGSLAAGAASLSGCLSLAGGDRAGTTSGTDRPSIPGLTIEVDSDPGYGITFGAALLNGFDAESPATVRISFTNEGEQRSIGFPSPPPFGGTGATAGNARLFLITPEELSANPTEERFYVPTARIEGCWNATHAPSFNALLSERTLDTGATLEHEYYVLGDPENETCIPDGTYEFDSSYILSPSEQESIEFEWGFTLTVAQS